MQSWNMSHKVDGFGIPFAMMLRTGRLEGFYWKYTIVK